MVKIMRLLTYEFPNEEIAVEELVHRSVKGTVKYGHCSIREGYYYTSEEAKGVLAKINPPVTEGEAPDGSK